MRSIGATCWVYEFGRNNLLHSHLPNVKYALATLKLEPNETTFEHSYMKNNILCDLEYRVNSMKRILQDLSTQLHSKRKQ